MCAKPLFKRPGEIGEVTIFLDGTPVRAMGTDSVAAAMLTADFEPSRASPVTLEPRAPYCMMGVCFECLVIIDGHHSQQACLTRVRQGMRVERQLAGRAVV